uniref:Uncharacterized protein n=1 Tax=Globodera rostochiensis TaxID=31243 RepID=A0A914GQJ3_GLORO
MYRKQDSLEQGLVTPPPPPPCRLKTGNNFRLPGDGSGSCLSRAPFASLIAFLCCLFGVLLFATMMAWAFAASVEQMRRALRVNNLPWLDKVHLLFLVSACVMVAVSLAFLLVGVLSTGRTRQSVFGRPADDGARRGGRISCVVAICLSFALNLLWTIVVIVTAILCFIYTILLMLCSSANDCLDFGVFSPLFNAQNKTLKFCGGELQQFCAVTNTVSRNGRIYFKFVEVLLNI